MTAEEMIDASSKYLEAMCWIDELADIQNPWKEEEEMSSQAERINASPRKCDSCGEVYRPAGPRSLFCPACREEAVRIYEPPVKFADRPRKCRICSEPMPYDAPLRARVCSDDCRRKAAELWQKEKGK
jgi:hypothetical protein